MSKESANKAIDAALEGMRWAKMRGEHKDAEMFRIIHAELIDLTNKVYGTSWIGVSASALQLSFLRGTPLSLGGNMPNRYEGRK